MKKYFVILLVIPALLNAQQRFINDTLQMQGDSVVVTANRTERKLSNITVPVNIVNATTQQLPSINVPFQQVNIQSNILTNTCQIPFILDNNLTTNFNIS